MGAVRFGVTDIVNVRFAVSPLWETVAGYRAALDPGGHAVHLPWIKKAVALLRDRDLAGRTAPLHALLTASPGPGPAGADFLTPAPRCPLAEFGEELAFLAPGPLADAVSVWWEAAVEPYWPRLRAVLEADISHRTRQLAEDGIRQVFTGLHPAVRWTGERLESAELPESGLDLDGSGITLAPTAFATRCHVLAGHGSAPPALVYPARAVATLWERRDGAGDGLARLLGRSRAGLLARTASPTTTTRLAAGTGLSPGAVSQHLSVLRDAGLVTSHRYRREVHYTASPLGAALLDRAQAAEPVPDAALTRS